MEEHPLVDEMRTFDLDDSSPLEALQQIKAWQEQLLDEAEVKPR
jgi:hypothetical protein